MKIGGLYPSVKLLGIRGDGVGIG